MGGDGRARGPVVNAAAFNLTGMAPAGPSEPWLDGGRRDESKPDRQGGMNFQFRKHGAPVSHYLVSHCVNSMRHLGETVVCTVLFSRIPPISELWLVSAASAQGGGVSSLVTDGEGYEVATVLLKDLLHAVAKR